MQELTGQEFERVMDRGGLVAQDIVFTQCTFDNCGLSLTNDPQRMSRVSRVALTGCTSMNSIIGPAYLDDIEIDGLKTGDIMIVWGALFRHVTLKGKIGSVKVNTAIQDPHASAACQASFDRLREQHYGTVDWALDISQARPTMLDLRGIPAALVRIDPRTQARVFRDCLASVDQVEAVKALDVNTRFILKQFVKSDAQDLVLAAPTGRGAKFYQPVVASFEALRSAGLAASD